MVTTIDLSFKTNIDMKYRHPQSWWKTCIAVEYMQSCSFMNQNLKVTTTTTNLLNDYSICNSISAYILAFKLLSFLEQSQIKMHIFHNGESIKLFFFLVNGSLRVIRNHMHALDLARISLSLSCTWSKLKTWISLRLIMSNGKGSYHIHYCHTISTNGLTIFYLSHYHFTLIVTNAICFDQRVITKNIILNL